MINENLETELEKIKMELEKVKKELEDKEEELDALKDWMYIYARDALSRWYAGCEYRRHRGIEPKFPLR